jgi:hypothetical protein
MEFVLKVWFDVSDLCDEVYVEELTRMLAAAGSKGHTAAIEWLLEQGAGWPAQLQWQPSWDQLDGHPWPHESVVWAAEQGCPAAVQQLQQ